MTDEGIKQMRSDLAKFCGLVVDKNNNEYYLPRTDAWGNEEQEFICAVIDWDPDIDPVCCQLVKDKWREKGNEYLVFSRPNSIRCIAAQGQLISTGDGADVSSLCESTAISLSIWRALKG